jgi:hypothetical protein
VGIAGLLRREEQKERRREDDMEQAFGDLSALTDKAREMVRCCQGHRLDPLPCCVCRVPHG